MRSLHVMTLLLVLLSAGCAAPIEAQNKILVQVCPKVAVITPAQQKALARIATTCVDPKYRSGADPFTLNVCGAFLWISEQYGKNRDQDRACAGH